MKKLTEKWTEELNQIAKPEEMKNALRPSDESVKGIKEWISGLPVAQFVLLMRGVEEVMWDNLNKTEADTRLFNDERQAS